MLKRFIIEAGSYQKNKQEERTILAHNIGENHFSFGRRSIMFKASAKLVTMPGNAIHKKPG